MRNTIIFLIAIMFLLICNIVAYSLSEDYRFFIKKIKYREEIVYDTNLSVDDSNNHVKVVKDLPGGEKETTYIEKESLTFLDALSGKSINLKEQEDILTDLTETEKDFLKVFEKFSLKQLQQKSSLFDITTEYPDDYYEYYSEDISVYIFSTKSYEEIYNIFDVLSFELPYTLKKVDNFGEKSFYINIDKSYNDNTVRIVLEYRKSAFGLKIKKDRYNEVKEVLKGLK